MQVRDGYRTLEFDGTRLANSDSFREGSGRWIEFELFRTTTGRYVLSRVGVSTFYHLPTCHIAIRGNLREDGRDTVREDDMACPECNPHLSNAPLVCFEKEKYWGRVFDSPAEVVQALTKEDPRTGTRYLTQVSKRLLDKAVESDKGFDISITEKVF